MVVLFTAIEISEIQAYHHAELSLPENVTQSSVTFNSSLPDDAVNPKLQFRYSRYLPKAPFSEYSDYMETTRYGGWEEFTEGNTIGIKTLTSSSIYLYPPKDQYTGLDQDTEITFEWASDNDEGNDSFTFSYYGYNEENIKTNVIAAEISGYSNWKKVSVILPQYASDIIWRYTKNSNGIGTGEVKIRNIEIHLPYYYYGDRAEWKDASNEWATQMICKDLPFDSQMVARVTAETPTGEIIYSPLREVKTKTVGCLKPSELTSSGMEIIPHQTSADIATHFNIGDLDGKYGVIINENPGNDLTRNPYIAYNVRLDGWGSLSDTSGEPVTISFDSPSDVKVILSSTIKGYGTSYATARVSEPFDTTATSRAENQKFEALFPAGHNSFTIKPNTNVVWMDTYSMSINLSFVPFNDLKKVAVQAREFTIYADTPDFKETVTGLKPNTKYTVTPFIETTGNIFAPYPENKTLYIGETNLKTLNGSVNTPKMTTTQTTAELNAIVEPGDGKIDRCGFRYGVVGNSNLSERTVEADESGEISLLLQRLKPDTEYNVQTWLKLENCDEIVYSELVTFKTDPIDIKLKYIGNTQSTASFNVSIDKGDAELSEVGYILKNKASNRVMRDILFDPLPNDTVFTCLIEHLPTASDDLTICVYAKSNLAPDNQILSNTVTFKTKDFTIGQASLKKIDSDMLMHIECDVDLGDTELETINVNPRLYNWDNPTRYSDFSAEDVTLNGKTMTFTTKAEGGDFKFLFRFKLLNGNTITKESNVITAFGKPKISGKCISADFSIPLEVIPDNPEKIEFYVNSNNDVEITTSIEDKNLIGKITGLEPGTSYYLSAKDLFMQIPFSTISPSALCTTSVTQTTFTLVKVSENLYDISPEDIKIKIRTSNSGYSAPISQTFTKDFKGDYFYFNNLLPYTEYAVEASFKYKDKEYKFNIKGTDWKTIDKVWTSSVSFPAIKVTPYQTAFVVDYGNKEPKFGDFKPVEWGYEVYYGKGSYFMKYIPVTESSDGKIIVNGLSSNYDGYSVYPYSKLPDGTIVKAIPTALLTAITE